jgi:hypothetical protein
VTRRRKRTTCGKAAFVWGATPPAVTVAYEKPLGTWDSGFSVLFDDAPTSEELDALPADAGPHDIDGLEVICLHCLINEHPELGRGMDIARRQGLAEFDEHGEWKP